MATPQSYKKKIKKARGNAAGVTFFYPVTIKNGQLSAGSAFPLHFTTD
jgi:hypothetical protein